MKKIIIFIVTFFGISSNLFASPISPRPLRKLVSESQFIIVGYVAKTYDNKEEDAWNNKVAKIVVLENLQGNIQKDTIELGFSNNIGCPSPAIYFEDSYVISFVDLDKKSRKFYTHALSYGSKTLKKDEIEIYKQRISEIQKILKISNKKKQFTETVEWLVKCAEIETTSWEGTFELSPESNFMSFYSRDKKELFNTSINANQKERLKTALLNKRDYVDFGLVDLVYKDNETLIDQFLLDKLKALKENEFWYASDFMIRLKHKNDSPETEKLISEFDELLFKSENIDDFKKAIKKFIELVEK